MPNPLEQYHKDMDFFVPAVSAAVDHYDPNEWQNARINAHNYDVRVWNKKDQELYLDFSYQHELSWCGASLSNVSALVRAKLKALDPKRAGTKTCLAQVWCDMFKEAHKV